MNCGTTDPAVDGRCPNPRCRALRKGAQLAAKGGPVNVTKREQLRARFKADYRPSTTLDEVRCQELADLTERLSTIKKGSSEYARVVATMASLDVALRQSRAIQQPPDLSSLSTDDLIAKLEATLAALRGDPSPFRRSDVDVSSPSGLAPQNIHISDAIQTPESSRPETVASPPETGLSDQSRHVGTNLTPATAQPAAETKSASPIASVPLQPKRTPQIEPSEEERKAAAIREKLGWNEGVIGTNGLYRRRE